MIVIAVWSLFFFLLRFAASSPLDVLLVVLRVLRPDGRICQGVGNVAGPDIPVSYAFSFRSFCTRRLGGIQAAQNRKYDCHITTNNWLNWCERRKKRPIRFFCGWVLLFTIKCLLRFFFFFLFVGWLMVERSEFAGCTMYGVASAGFYGKALEVLVLVGEWFRRDIWLLPFWSDWGVRAKFLSCFWCALISDLSFLLDMFRNQRKHI